MAQMVRKQIYLYKQQETLLRRVAEARGVSEAEVIRQALEQVFNTGVENAAQSSKSPLDEFAELARGTKSRKGKPYKWNRQDAYEERDNKLMGRLSNNDKADSD
jgi:DNA-binding SARP family transcriptional activator